MRRTIAGSMVIALGFALAPGLVAFPDIAPAARADGVTLSAFGTAVIDGEIGSGEWDRAARLPFSMTIPDHDGGGTVPATLYVMNDATTLYAAVRAQGFYAAFNPGFEFDNDDDGVWPEQGDDVFLATAYDRSPAGPLVFTDDFRGHCPDSPAGQIACASEDGDTHYPNPGTRDGAAAGFTSEALRASFIEMSHPLDSADDAHDFSVHAGDTMGFFLFTRAISSASGSDCGWPECTGDTRVPGSGYSHIRVATSGSAPSPAPTPTLTPVTGADTAWSAFGTATVDGRYVPGEWAGAARLDLAADLPTSLGTGKVPVGVSFMNDDRDLYVAIRVGRPFATATISLDFDNDGDGVSEPGDDVIVVNSRGTGADLIDDFRTECPAGVQSAFLCSAEDADPKLTSPGTTDGMAASGMGDGTYLVELRHPLDSADDAHDFSLKTGDVVGVVFRVFFDTLIDGCAGSRDCTGQAFTNTTIRVADSSTKPSATPPTTTAVATPSAGAAGWWTSAAKVMLTGSDGTRGIHYWASPAVDGGVIVRGQDAPLVDVIGARASLGIEADGRTVVRWYATDKAGVRGPWQSTEVRIDRTPPEVSPPAVTFVHDAVLGAGAGAARVQWAGVDALSASIRYVLQESRDAGPWRTVGSTSSSVAAGGGSTVRRHLTIGSRYQYRVRATDAAGNAGPWRAGPVYRVALIDSGDPRITLVGAWKKVADRDAIGGEVLVATRAGASASVGFAGSAVALVGATAKGRGSVALRLDGVPAGIATFARPPADGRIVWRTAGSTGARHTLTVTLLSSARVDIDAFLVLEQQVPVQAVHEAEHLRSAVVDGGRAPATQARPMDGGPDWRGDGQLYWSPPGVTSMTVFEPVSVGGDYGVTLFLTKGPGYGRIVVTVPGFPPATFDLWAPQLSGPFAVGLLPMPIGGPGAVGIEVRIEGRNTASTGFALGIDRIVLTPAP
jgi:hypothetical protein